MADNIFKPRGGDKARQPNAGGAAAKTVPMFGVERQYRSNPLR